MVRFRAFMKNQGISVKLGTWIRIILIINEQMIYRIIIKSRRNLKFGAGLFFDERPMGLIFARYDSFTTVIPGDFWNFGNSNFF